jgi:hypothetical protein
MSLKVAPKRRSENVCFRAAVGGKADCQPKGRALASLRAAASSFALPCHAYHARTASFVFASQAQASQPQEPSGCPSALGKATMIGAAQICRTQPMSNVVAAMVRPALLYNLRTQYRLANHGAAPDGGTRMFDVILFLIALAVLSLATTVPGSATRAVVRQVIVAGAIAVAAVAFTS